MGLADGIAWEREHGAPDRPIVAEQQGGDGEPVCWLYETQCGTVEFAEEYDEDVHSFPVYRHPAPYRIQAIKKVRDGYADQARFADAEPAAYFREFVRRIDAALASPTTAP